MSEFRVLVWAEDEHLCHRPKLWAYIEYPNELEEEKANGDMRWSQMRMDFVFQKDLTDKKAPVEEIPALLEQVDADYEDALRDSTVAVEVKNGIGIARLTER